MTCEFLVSWNTKICEKSIPSLVFEETGNRLLADSRVRFTRVRGLFFPKEPYVSAKEPYMSATETCKFAKEHNISATAAGAAVTLASGDRCGESGLENGCEILSLNLSRCMVGLQSAVPSALHKEKMVIRSHHEIDWTLEAMTHAVAALVRVRRCCVCIDTHTYTHTYIHICTHMHSHKHIQTNLHIHTHTTYTHTRTHCGACAGEAMLCMYCYMYM